jgi:hypothetical protein
MSLTQNDTKSNLKEILMKNRPALSTNSLNAYSSNLKNLFLKNNKDKEFNLEWFSNENNILESLKDLEPARRKTYLASVIVLINDPEKTKQLQEQMMKDSQKWHEDNKEQIKSIEQEENWITQDEIKVIFNTYLKNARYIWNKKNKDSNDLELLNKLVLLALMSGLFIPVRRSLDYSEFKIKNIDPEKDNYLNKKTKSLVFNVYKTSKIYKKQEIIIPNKLYNILVKWIKINPTEYLLFDKNLKKMNSVKIRNLFNEIFGKNTSTNILRHSYISSKYKADLKELLKDAEQMGTSATTLQTQYIKR